MKTLQEIVKDERKKLNANTFQFLRWLKSDPELWHDCLSVQRWLQDNPEPTGMRWVTTWERALDAVRYEWGEMLRYLMQSDDCPFDHEFMFFVSLDQIQDLIEEDNVLLEYVEDPFRLDERHEEKKRRIFLQTTIKGKTEIKHEDFGGNVGPVVEPGAQEMADQISNVEQIVEAIAPRVKIFEIEEQAS